MGSSYVPQSYVTEASLLKNLKDAWTVQNESSERLSESYLIFRGFRKIDPGLYSLTYDHKEHRLVCFILREYVVNINGFRCSKYKAMRITTYTNKTPSVVIYGDWFVDSFDLEIFLTYLKEML